MRLALFSLALLLSAPLACPAPGAPSPDADVEEDLLGALDEDAGALGDGGESREAGAARDAGGEGGGGLEDAGEPDVEDGGALDAGAPPFDGPSSDGGAPGAEDAGGEVGEDGEDGGLTDAGAPEDAGPGDAGVQDGPIVLTGGDHGGTPIRITLHSSAALIARNGRISEEMVALYAARAFDAAGYDYEVVYNLPAELPPDEVAVCGNSQAFPWWQQRVNSDAPLERRKDANLLLLDAGGGGCGAVGGWVGTAPGRNIDERRAWSETGGDTWHRNIHGSLHEIGHQLGMRHDHDPDAPGAQHLGEGWNQIDADGTGSWHRTPSVAGSGAPNGCGADIEAKIHARVVRHQLYSACAAAAFRVAPE